MDLRKLKLTPRQVEKPWGRRDLPPPFHNSTGETIGEVWFEDSRNENLDFLVKYIFTSERLSVQVHPDDATAKARGSARGKTECWYVLDAQPGAEIGIGLSQSVNADGLRRAALDGSVMELLNWVPVARGDFFHVPAGTVHAIGAGVSLLEFQQNSDITYRLYDYGRPRALHLDEALSVATLDSYTSSCRRSGMSVGSVLHTGDDFTFVRARDDAEVPGELLDRRRWVMPIAGSVTADGEPAAAGDCLLVEPGTPLQIDDDSVVLIAAGGRVHA